jgi:D-3-phosphoglycerate dehydrogenase
MNESSKVLYIATDSRLHQPPDWFYEAFVRDGLTLVQGDCWANEADNAVLAPNARAMLVGSGRYPVTSESLGRLASCGLIVRMGAGYDTVDVAEATRRGVMVANMPANIPEEVSDHAIALFLTCLRRLVPQTVALRSGNWEPYYAYPALRLRGQTLGLVGCGRIARKVVAKMVGFGLTCIAYDPYTSAAEVADLGIELVDFEALLSRADVISLHAPATAETRELFNAEAFARMKPSAILINTARGALVDEQALVTALQTGQIRAAGLDVFAEEPLKPDNPLLQLDNVVLTPHVASYSEDGLVDYFQAGHRLISEFVLDGKVPDSLVNPDVLQVAS